MFTPQIYRVCFCIVVATLAAGCDEFLPPRGVPPEPFVVSITPSYLYAMPGPVTPFRNQLIFDVVVKNIYDETIEDTLDFYGEVSIEWNIQRENRIMTVDTTFSFTDKDIKFHTGYDRTTKVLTMDPNDSLGVELIWNFMMDDTVLTLDSLFTVHRGYCTVSIPQAIRYSGFVHMLKHRSNLYCEAVNYNQCFLVDSANADCRPFVLHPCPP